MTEETTYESRTFAQYVNGSEGERLKLERIEPGIVGLYEHSKCWAPRPADEARTLRAIARAILWDPQHPASHHGDWSDLARENCAVCVLHGWAPRSDEAPEDGSPNWAGWERVYVQAGATIPDDWRHGFAALLDDDSPYAECLGRDIATFGLMDGRGLVKPERRGGVV